MNSKRLLATGVLLFFESLLIVFLIHGDIVWICLAIGALTASCFLLIARWARRSRGGKSSKIGNLFPILCVVLPFVFGYLTLYLGYFSPILAILATALTIEFFSNFLALPLSIYHKHLETEFNNELKPADHWPSVSIIVPAHNEEKVIEQCIAALIEIDYPKKEVIVVDDGSTDRTYELATTYEQEGVKVFHRSNARGKSAALNTGILFAKGEIIVTCDADSLIARDAIRKIAIRFEDPMVNAVAGNVKVLNRTNLLTRCQALEYIVDLNIYRRVFDVFGVVPVVPGPLAAFRKSVLKEIGFYDRDTLTEDFDITVKVLKTGKIVQALSEAFVYSEAPASWKDFYGQRLRWNRGTFQTLLKHRDVFRYSRFGFVHDLTFPYVLLSMLFIPLVSLVSIAVIITAALAGSGFQVLYVIGGFILLQATYSFLAIQMDNEDLKLIIYSPLFVVGYKEIRNFIKIKALIDILRKKEMKWGAIQRIGVKEDLRNTRITNQLISSLPMS
jgi:cellulose synthase/poly-beta-1,6-N-acetylglucosamine synthase-like glycosyltransferase